jgi:hypothetical protein
MIDKTSPPDKLPGPRPLLRQARAAVLLRVLRRQALLRLCLNGAGYRLVAAYGLRRSQTDRALSDLLTDGRVRLFAGDWGCWSR